MGRAAPPPSNTYGRGDPGTIGHDTIGWTAVTVKHPKPRPPKPKKTQRPPRGRGKGLVVHLNAPGRSPVVALKTPKPHLGRGGGHTHPTGEPRSNSGKPGSVTHPTHTSPSRTKHGGGSSGAIGFHDTGISAAPPGQEGNANYGTVIQIGRPPKIVDPYRKPGDPWLQKSGQVRKGHAGRSSGHTSGKGGAGNEAPTARVPHPPRSPCDKPRSAPAGSKWPQHGNHHLRPYHPQRLCESVSDASGVRSKEARPRGHADATHTPANELLHGQRARARRRPAPVRHPLLTHVQHGRRAAGRSLRPTRKGAQGTHRPHQHGTHPAHAPHIGHRPHRSLLSVHRHLISDGAPTRRPQGTALHPGKQAHARVPRPRRRRPQPPGAQPLARAPPTQPDAAPPLWRSPPRVSLASRTSIPPRHPRAASPQPRSAPPPHPDPSPDPQRGRPTPRPYPRATSPHAAPHPYNRIPAQEHAPPSRPRALSHEP